MKEIQLGYRKGNPKFIYDLKILIDDSDYDIVSQYNWWRCWYKRKSGRVYYATTRINGKRVLLHRFLMNAEYDQIIDHKDGNGLNCQRNNLRFCTKAQNSMNRVAAGKSKYLGVSYRGYGRLYYRKKTNDYSRCLNKKPWRSVIVIDGKLKHIGLYEKEIDAAIAYDAYARIYFKEFARLNFPEINISIEDICNLKK
jgi:hypothetical protein